MNTATEHDRQFAEKLKSLSLQPVAFDPEPPKRHARLFLNRVGVLAIVTVASLYALIVFQPGELYRFGHKMFGGVTAGAAGSSETDIAKSTGKDLAAPAREDLARAAQTAPAVLSGAVPATRGVTGSGYVVALDSAAIYSKYEGKIVEIAVEVGDKVEAGQLLVRLDDAGARFALRGARIAKASAEIVLAARNIDLAQANSSLDRIKTLVARGTAPRQQLEDAASLRDRAVNSVGQARQDLARAELALERAEDTVSELNVRAPIAGTVTTRNARLGEIVLARADSVRENASLLTITDTMSLVIDADIAESSIALLRPGLRGEAVLDAFPDQPFDVQIDRIAPVASADKGTVSLRLSLRSAPAGIRPNMAVRISIAASATVAAINQRGTQK